MLLLHHRYYGSLFLFLLLFFPVPQEQKFSPLIEKIYFENVSLHSLRGDLYLPSNGNPDKVVMLIVSIEKMKKEVEHGKLTEIIWRPK